tara:strand:- start:9817 stop:10569 length:753 start_codon:yes stop_codon:yes gene_type:complete
MLLALDIGNTNITVGIVENSEIIMVHRIKSHTSANEGLTDIDLSKITNVIISSVAPKKTIDYQNWCRMHLNLKPFIIKHNNIIGLKLDVEKPSSVGADRICNIVGANKKYSGRKIIVDFGTATTYDVINKNGIFIGGAISPGIDVSANNLYNKAALLKNTAFKFPKNVVGRNTETNLQSGIMFGAVESLEGMIIRIQNEMNWQNCRIILTGGFSTVISPGLSIKHDLEPFLTLFGIEVINDINKLHIIKI